MLSPRVLDFKENIVFDPEKTELKNFQAPNHLVFGLLSLANTVRIEEFKLTKGFNGKGPSIYMGGINPIVPNAFMWFSITIVNYLRFIGMIDYLNKNKLKFESLQDPDIKKSLKAFNKKYMKKIIPEIYTWRNKVSAHFAAVDPFETDSIAVLEYSLMNLVSFSDKYYEVGRLNFGVADDETNFEPWALTKTFEDLSERYWPELKLANFKIGG